MTNSYKIIVKNQTGGKQNYHFFSAQPVVSGGSCGDLWSNVMKAANNTPNAGVASFQVSTSYYAICGSFDNSPSAGVTRAVIRGAWNANDSIQTIIDFGSLGGSEESKGLGFLWRS
ncbi:hypothetical protein E4U54_008517 [Claviceps lovelessii]|nr:hypothetical protein E4U54_008517 [Claviceps lovelessii]